MLYTATVYIGYMDCQASSNPIQFSPHQLQSYQPLIRFICSWRLYNQTVFSCKRKIRITKVFLFCFVNSIVEVFSKIFALDLSGYRTTGNRPTSRMSPRSYREKAVEPCTMAWITASTSSKKGRMQLLMEAALPLTIAGEIRSVRQDFPRGSPKTD